MAMKIHLCPFCGSANLKASSRRTRGMKNHYLTQVFCLKCGARGPIVKSSDLDWRDTPTYGYMDDLEKKAFAAFTTVEEKKAKACAEPEELKLEP